MLDRRELIGRLSAVAAGLPFVGAIKAEAPKPAFKGAVVSHNKCAFVFNQPMTFELPIGEIGRQVVIFNRSNGQVKIIPAACDSFYDVSSEATLYPGGSVCLMFAQKWLAIQC